MDSTSKTSADDATKLNSDLSEFVEKLRIELDAKDKELTEHKQQNKEYRQTIVTFQTTFWKIFPTACTYYYIKVPSSPNGQFNKYLYADCSGQMHSATDGEPFLCASKFKFQKEEGGSYSICSASREKYLTTEWRATPTPLYFDGDRNEMPVKFVLYFHPECQQPGIVVDIRSLANDCFLSLDDQNRVVAYSPTAPDNKFLLIPAPAADEQ